MPIKAPLNGNFTFTQFQYKFVSEI